MVFTCLVAFFDVYCVLFATTFVTVCLFVFSLLFWLVAAAFVLFDLLDRFCFLLGLLVVLIVC